MKAKETADIRINNLYSVWEAIQRRGSITRTELAADTRLSLMSISNLVDLLIRSGLICAQADTDRAEARTTGRRADILRVNSAHHKWLVLDLTDPFFRWELIRPDRKLELSGAPRKYDEKKDCGANLGAFLAQCRQELGPVWGNIGGIAIVAPGPYDMASDTIVNTRIPGMNSLHLKQTAAQALGGLPVFLDEDVKFAARAYGELAAQEESLYYLYAGEGVGGALVYQGSVFRSLNSVAGDPSLLEILGNGPGTAGLTLRAFASGLGLKVEGISGSVLEEELRKTAEEDPLRYEQALSEAVEGIVKLLRTAQAMLDPHSIVADCLWAAPMQARFLTLLRERLKPVLPLRKQPLILEPVLPLHAPWYGAVKALEKDMIRRLRSSV